MTAHCTPVAARRAPKRDGLMARLMRLRALRRQRRDLANLPPNLLRDVGISVSDARREGDRPVWDAPDNWLK